ncbi:MAG: chorismate-binding protein [Spirochaetales bacterium]|nr:chorismate-binding protein [Spirochaetales bacterium]
MPEKRMDTIIRTLPGERFTPFALADKLNARIILESAAFTRGRSRYSILMVHEAFRVAQEGDEIYIVEKGKRKRVRSGARDILDVLAYFSNQHSFPAGGFPFPAGGIGFLSYEFSRMCDTISFTGKADPLNLPDALFLFGHVFIVFDHFTDVIYLIGLNYKEQEIDLEKALEETERKINDLNFNYLAPRDRDYSAQLIFTDEEKESFLKGVTRIREEIVKGNLLQGVISRRMRVKTDLPALEAYRKLRSTNPSPYLFYIDFDDFQLFGSSPEVHVKINDGRALLRPIAGTRRRGANAKEDKELEKELLADPKEGAEHLMLVDLGRNDLGRICRSGTVEATEFRTIEKYSHVMHIVSQVEGDLDEGKTAADAIRATFPAGTVSGAPKIQAIETIDKLEIYPRKFYAGLIGIMEPEGNMDSCITIRSALKKGDSIYMQAGAGIVYDSTPERELEETGEKLRAMATALGVEV